jgi:DNA-binding SARP family transcriptional activator
LGIEVRLLGVLEAADGGAVLEVRGTKQRALLALLALNVDEVVTTDRLVDAVWGDDLPKNPANALQLQVVQLRRTLGADRIATLAGGYALVGVDVDAARFASLVGQGLVALDAGDAAEARTVLRDALALCRGTPLTRSLP